MRRARDAPFFIYPQEAKATRIQKRYNLLQIRM
jgi:hypothetical protein